MDDLSDAVCCHVSVGVSRTYAADSDVVWDGLTCYCEATVVTVCDMESLA